MPLPDFYYRHKFRCQDSESKIGEKASWNSNHTTLGVGSKPKNRLNLTDKLILYRLVFYEAIRVLQMEFNIKTEKINPTHTHTTHTRTMHTLRISMACIPKGTIEIPSRIKGVMRNFSALINWEILAGNKAMPCVCVCVCVWVTLSGVSCVTFWAHTHTHIHTHTHAHTQHGALDSPSRSVCVLIFLWARLLFTVALFFVGSPAGSKEAAWYFCLARHKNFPGIVR